MKLEDFHAAYLAKQQELAAELKKHPAIAQAQVSAIVATEVVRATVRQLLETADRVVTSRVSRVEHRREEVTAWLAADPARLVEGIDDPAARQAIVDSHRSMVATVANTEAATAVLAGYYLDVVRATVDSLVGAITSFLRHGDAGGLATKVEGAARFVVGVTPIGWLAAALEALIDVIERRDRKAAGAEEYFTALEAHTEACVRWSLVAEVVMARWDGGELVDRRDVTAAADRVLGRFQALHRELQ